MKKINIISFTETNNYGALLQIFALQKIFLKYGFRAEHLRHKNVDVVKNKKQKIFSYFYNLIFFKIFKNKKRIENENEFKSKIVFSNKFYNSGDAIKSISGIVVGSDQVWNHRINNKNSFYLGDLDIDCPIFSYAASFGLNKSDNEWEKKLNLFLPKFKNLSVREKSSLPYISKYNSKKTVDIDPTLLLEKTIWEHSCNLKRIFKKKYVLCYLMPGYKRIEKTMIYNAKKIAKEKKLKLIIIGDKEYKRIFKDKYHYFSAGPEQFLSLIYNAEFIFTNSFHGTAFSVNFGKNFYSFVDSSLPPAKNFFSRINDLLDSLGLCDRIIDCSKEQSILAKNVNFCDAIKKLNSLRAKSYKTIEYIIENLL